MKKLAIISQTKSGTTALYYKILHSLTNQNVIGVFEPEQLSIPTDKEYDYLLVKALIHNNTTLDLNSIFRFDKLIYIVRDPRDWLISRILFEMRGVQIAPKPQAVEQVIELLRQKETKPKSISMYDLMSILAKYTMHNTDNMIAWIRNQQLWLAGFEQQLQIHDHILFYYEDMIDNRLNKLEQYLGFSLLAGESQVEKDHQHVIRSKSYGNWKDWFVESDINYFKPLFSHYIKQHAYPDDWTLNNNPRIDPKLCSEYVINNMGKY